MGIPMRSKISYGLIIVLLAYLALLLGTPSVAHADGGAPNLAYVAGSAQGISVIDVAQQKVTGNIPTQSTPHMILLSLDARFIYATEPDTGKVAILGAKTGETICTANVAGQPSLLALDGSTNILYAAGNGANTVTSLDATNCSIKRTFQVKGAVQGLAVATIGTSISGSSGNQLWVADTDSLTIFDGVNGNQLGNVPIPGGPQYVSIPPGATVYVTTRQGSIVAVGLNQHQPVTLVTGGTYGPMDYDQITGQVYVPDMQKEQIVVLAPVNPGFTPPHEPVRTISLGVQPVSIAITSDGQLGFVALSGGNVAMLDIPARGQVINTFSVGGDPRFVITGMYPPVIGTTPQQANQLGIIINIAAYAFVIALLIIPILLFRRYAKARTQVQQTTDEIEPPHEEP